MNNSSIVTKKPSILFILFLILLTTLPFIHIFASQIGGPIISGTRDAIIITLILSLSLKIVKNGEIAFTKFEIFIFLFIIYGFFHIFISLTDILIALDKFRLLYLYPILSLILIIYFRNKITNINFSLEFILNLFVFQGIVIIIISILEFFLRDQLLILLYKDQYSNIQRNLLGQTGIRLVSTLYNPINLGIFLNLFLIVLLYKKNKSNIFRFYNPIVKAVIVFLTIIIILLTYSRLSYLILVLTLIFYVILNSNKLISLRTVFLIILTLILFQVGNTFMNQNIDNLNKRISQLNIEYLMENERIKNWEIYLKQMSSIGDFHLIWGGGLGTSSSDTKSQDTFVKRVENSYISFMGELGIIGLLMFLMILIRSFINIIIMYKNNSREAKIFFQLLLVLVIGGITTDIFHNNPFSFYFWCIFSYLELNRYYYRDSEIN